jgi:hypothetical protein
MFQRLPIGDPATDPLNKWRAPFAHTDDPDTYLNRMVEDLTQAEIDEMNAELLVWVGKSD